MAMTMIMERIMAVVVVGSFDLAFGIAQHQRFDHPA
jgi:hypothetical protein